MHQALPEKWLRYLQIYRVVVGDLNLLADHRSLFHKEEMFGSPWPIELDRELLLLIAAVVIEPILYLL